MSTPQIRQHGLYGEDSISVRPEFIHIEPISARSGPRDWTIWPHAHPGIMQLLVVSQGGGTLAAEAIEARLEEGALIHLPPGAVHAFRFDPGTEGWVLSLAADLLSDPRVAVLAPPRMVAAIEPRWVRLAPASPCFHRLGWLISDTVSRLSDAVDDPVSPALVAQLCLMLALADEALSDGPKHDHAVSAKALLARRFRQLVNSRYRDGWTIERYAGSLGTSVPTLSRACREATGKPPGDILLDRVLLEAMRALTYTSEPVSRISDGLGFSDPAYFARFFKRRAGKTASAFRREGGWLRVDRTATGD